MFRGIYSAANAMEMASNNHEIVSENIVHATTPGYRRQGLLFEVSENTSIPPPRNVPAAPGVGGPGPGNFAYFEAGPLQQTNNPYDLALTGDAFFVVQGPGGPLYTRNGSFERGATGELLTRGGGYRVPGVNIPADAAAVTVASDGAIFANGAEVGRLQLASFARPQALQRVGTTLFSGAAPQTPPPGTVRVEQGFREGSNVEPVKEMVAMILGMRFYEAAGKALQAMSDAVAQNTRAQS